jgi:hypothetical protein
MTRSEADQPVEPEKPRAGVDHRRDSRSRHDSDRAAIRTAAVIEGGVGDNEFVGATTIKGAVLAVNGVLYVTAPDNVWALDAQDGHLLWRFFWRTRGGTHIGNRGAAMWRNYLFFVTPDGSAVRAARRELRDVLPDGAPPSWRDGPGRQG